MSRWYCGFFMAMACLLQASCVPPPPEITPAEAVARLRTGTPLLSCREACVAAWRTGQPQAAQLAAKRRWADLAALLVRIGYQDDLSLYYLGQAAEGLGYPGAAASYYRQSTYVTGTTISCQHLSRVCGGLAFPRAAVLRLAAIEQNLIRPRLRRPAPVRREPGEPGLAEPQPATQPETPSPAVWESPPAAAEPAPQAMPAPAAPAPPAPAPAAPKPGTSDFIEPPPAPR